MSDSVKVLMLLESCQISEAKPSKPLFCSQALQCYKISLCASFCTSVYGPQTISIIFLYFDVAYGREDPISCFCLYML